MLENIILIRNIFYKLFLLGFLFYIFSIMFLLLNNEWSIHIITNTFHISRAETNFLIADFVGWSKMFLVFFSLLPALALHWTGHSLKTKR